MTQNPGYDQRRAPEPAYDQATASKAGTTTSRATASRATSRPATGSPPMSKRLRTAGTTRATASSRVMPSRATNKAATANRATTRAMRSPARVTSRAATASKATSRVTASRVMTRLRPAGRLRLPAGYGQQGYEQGGYGQQGGYDYQQGYGRPAAGYAPTAITLILEDGSNRTFQLREAPTSSAAAGCTVPPPRHRRLASSSGDPLGRQHRDAHRPELHQRHHRQRRAGQQLGTRRRRPHSRRSLRHHRPLPVGVEFGGTTRLRRGGVGADDGRAYAGTTPVDAELTHLNDGRTGLSHKMHLGSCTSRTRPGGDPPYRRRPTRSIDDR